jgi:hypothetical protein
MTYKIGSNVIGSNVIGSNQIESNIMEWNKDKCSNEAKLYIHCMKKPPIENKCKYLFEEWLKCINLKYK